MATGAGVAILQPARSLIRIATRKPSRWIVPKAPLLATSRFASRSSYGSLNFLHGVFQSGAKASSVKNTVRVFCSTPQKDLGSKKCVPCESEDIRPMTEQAAQELLPQVEGWILTGEDRTLKLHKSWKVKSFMKGLEFFQLVADVAEAEGHHPDLHLVGWNNVKIDIWTHSVGGLTENDFILAAKIDSLELQHLLRRSV